MKKYNAFVSYVARDSVGGEIINSSAGTDVTIKAENQEKMVSAIVKHLQDFHKGVVTELKIIKV